MAHPALTAWAGRRAGTLLLLSLKTEVGIIKSLRGDHLGVRKERWKDAPQVCIMLPLQLGTVLAEVHTLAHLIWGSLTGGRGLELCDNH